MACNCGKRSQVTGFGRTGREQQESQRAGAAAAERVQLTAPDGKKTVHGSHLEASAARVRAGGGTIRPA